MFQLTKKLTLKLNDTVIFLRQFATLLDASIPIMASCEIILKTTKHSALQQFMLQTKSILAAGHPLSTSLQSYPGILDPLSQQLIKAGEQTGQLDKQLLTVANHYEKRLLLQQRILQALVYPCFIGVVALVILMGMFLFIIPRFAEFYIATYETLPLFTRALFAASAAISHYGQWFLLIITLGFYFSETIKQQLRLLVWRIPRLHHLHQQWLLLQFLQNMRLCYEAGLPITQVLTLASGDQAILPLTITTQLLAAIHDGLSLHLALLKTDYFPSMVLEMIKIGEESGQLGNMLQRAADLYENELMTKIDRSLKLLEPLIMLSQGVLIGGILVGLYLPVFNLGNSI